MKPRIGLTSSPSTQDDRCVEAVERAYVTAVIAAGGVPLILPVTRPEDVPDVLSCVDGILLSGGGDVDPALYGQLPSPNLGTVDPERDAFELALAVAGAQQGLPMLGICRGVQVLNVAFGGTLVQHLPDVTDLVHCDRARSKESVHRVNLMSGSGLSAATGQDDIGVNSLHHQAVDEVGNGLVAAGWAEDGTIEVLEGLAPHRILGVQWHPELLVADACHAALFDWLVVAAQQPLLRIDQAAAAA